MREEMIRKMARRRAGFIKDLIAYIVVITLCILLNIWKNPGHPWALWPAIGWGIGIIVHAFYAYGPEHGSIEEEEYKKLKDKLGK